MTVDRVSAAYPLQLARLLMVQPPTPARHKEIEDLLTEALAKDPLNRPEAYRLLARLYLEQGRVEEAGVLLERAVAHYRGRQLAGGMAYVLLWPEVAALYQDWAAYLRGHGRPEAAEMVLTALLRDDPSWTPAYLALAELAVRRGAVAEAARILKGGMAHDAGEVVWQRWRALTSRRGQVYER
jgi:tetratricopeptide (TPR) repeat protein